MPVATRMTQRELWTRNLHRRRYLPGCADATAPQARPAPHLAGCDDPAAGPEPGARHRDRWRRPGDRAVAGRSRRHPRSGWSAGARRRAWHRCRAASSLLDQLTERGVVDSGGADVVPLRDLPTARSIGWDPISRRCRCSILDETVDRSWRRSAQACGRGPRRGSRSVRASRCLCAAAGVGRLVVTTPPSRHPDHPPGGIASTLEVVGATRRPASPPVGCHPPYGSRPGPEQRSTWPSSPRPARSMPTCTDRLMRDGVPHLIARIQETTGVIGPLVVPGRSSCLRCHDLHRCDRDPAWPRLAAQLATDPVRPARGASAPTASACDVTLASAVAAHAVMQALAFLDGDTSRRPPSTAPSRCRFPTAGMRRRSWTPHPGCGCAWGAASSDAAIVSAHSEPRRGSWWPKQIENGHVPDLPIRAVTRTAKLASLPLGMAGTRRPGSGQAHRRSAGRGRDRRDPSAYGRAGVPRTR